MEGEVSVFRGLGFRTYMQLGDIDIGYPSYE